jgi:hypothetical protein
VKRTAPNEGVHRKFKVTRTDGSSRKGKKHAECSYFVLDLEHDPFAIPALKAYAKACKKTHPALAEDLEEILATRPCGCRSVGECTHQFAAQTPGEALALMIEES